MQNEKVTSWLVTTMGVVLMGNATFRKIKKLTRIAVIIDLITIIASFPLALTDVLNYFRGAQGNGLILFILPLVMAIELAPKQLMVLAPNFWAYLMLVIKWCLISRRPWVLRRRNVSAEKRMDSFVNGSEAILVGMVLHILTNFYMAIMMFIKHNPLVGEYSKWLIFASAMASTVFAVLYSLNLGKFKTELKYMTESAKEKFISENL